MNIFRGVFRQTLLLSAIVHGMVTYFLVPESRRSLQGRALWLQTVCRNALAALGVRVRQEGTVAPGAIVAANHLSYLDILVISSLTPVIFVSKDDVRRWPVFGWFATQAGTRFINRAKRGDVARIVDELAPVLSSGLTVVIFMEGTTTGGETVLPFKSSLIAPAVRGGWPILAAALSYRVPAGRSVSQEVCYWGEMTLVPHLLRLTTLPWIEARVAWGQREIACGDRKDTAAQLREQVIALKERLDAVVEETGSVR